MCTSLGTPSSSERCILELFFFSDQKIKVGGVEMLIMILGNPTYFLLLWLMKSYMGCLAPSKEQFNYRLSKCRMVMECAFRHLKGRFRSLLTRLDLSKCNITFVVLTCCVLHNLCESKGERYVAGGGQRQSI